MIVTKVGNGCYKNIKILSIVCGCKKMGVAVSI